MKNFDKAALGVLLILALALAATILLGGQAGVRVSATLPDGSALSESKGIAPFQKITLTFSEPVNPQMAEALLDIQPAVDGRIEWLDSRSLTFSPSRPFELAADHRLSLRPGILSDDGAELKREQSWQMKVRDPLVAYQQTSEGESAVWAIGLNGEPAQRLTPEGVKVVSFDASYDGEFIIFPVANEKAGIDLWRVSRSGIDAAILLDCGLDRCTMPAISPNGLRIAYSREAAGPSPDLPYGSPRIWVLDLQSGSNNAVYADQQILGYGPAWSPDSQKVTSYDGLADQIRMFDLATSQQFVFPSNTGGPVTWSADSTKFMFTDIQQGENGLHTRVRLADLSLNDTTTLLGEYDEIDYSYYSLAWSPAEDVVALGFRKSEDSPAQVFWLFDPGILDGIIIADEEGYTYNQPSWNPWGSALVFQQFKLKGKFKPEIGVWESGMSAPLIIGEGLNPQWLP
jgi:Tol biopolymer transport system component